VDALQSVSRGRVAISSAALPTIEPVIFALDGDSIVFEAAAGSRLAAATEDTVIGDPVEADRARALIPTSSERLWTDHVVRIPLTKVEGKRTIPRVGLRVVVSSESALT